MLLLAGEALLDVGVVVAAIAMDLLVADLKNIIDERVQKGAVVRDHQDRAGIIFEIILEPAERFEIQVIGRLIEHQEVGFHDEEPGEVRAHDPTAAHGFGGTMEIGFAEGEAGENALGLRLVLVTAELGIAAEGVVVFLGVGAAGAGAVGENAHEPAVLGGDGDGEFENGLVAARGGFLREVADGGVLVDDN